MDDVAHAALLMIAAWFAAWFLVPRIVPQAWLVAIGEAVLKLVRR